jgi:hypothetical protein
MDDHLTKSKSAQEPDSIRQFSPLDDSVTEDLWWDISNGHKPGRIIIKIHRSRREPGWIDAKERISWLENGALAALEWPGV